MERPIILVTGSHGQLGSEIKSLADEYSGYHFVLAGKDLFPVQNHLIGREMFEKYHPSFCINTAAYTAVDKAESDQEAAELINGTAVGHLAALCKQFGTQFIHISTDYVFNGASREPLHEACPVDPVNFYGASKLLGEQLAFQQNRNTVIIRTSWLYSSFGKNFVRSMIRLMKDKKSIGVVADQIGSPTYAADLAQAIMKVITNHNWVPGIFHFCNSGALSWFDFAVEIKNLTGAACKVDAITTKQYPTAARRPVYSVLNTDKISKIYGVEIKNWKGSLGACIKVIKTSEVSGNVS